METELDLKDKKLLYELDLDARQTFSQIGKKIGVSKQLVKYRIERLEEKGIIKGYYPMIDISRLGYLTFRVYLKFRNLTEAKEREIINYLKRSESIWAIVSFAGTWDLGLGISVKNIHEFYEVWEDLLKKYLKNIGDYHVSIYSPIYHYSKSYLVDKKDHTKIRVLGGRSKVDIDKKDFYLLQLLSQDARISLIELSKKIGLTAEAVSNRIKGLEKKEVIQGYRAMIDIGKLGYHFYKANIRLSDYSRIDKILEYCHQHKNIYQVDKTIGGETLELEFHVQDLREMLGIIKELEKQFSGTIERFNYTTIISEEKITFMPGGEHEEI